MPYTEDEGGLLNNFAREPKVYQAEPMSSGQKRNMLFLLVGVSLLVGGLVFVAFSVSSAS